MASQRGTPSASLTTLVGPSGRELTAVLDHGGADIVGLFGHGEQRRLALAEGAPLVPGGYVVYAEIPLPEGTILKSGFSGLQYALYDGRSTNGPVLFATTKALPFTGQQVSQPMNLDDLDTTLGPILRVPTSSLSLAPVVRWSGLSQTCCPGSLEDWRSSSAFSPRSWSKRPPAARTKPSASWRISRNKNAALDRAMAEQVKGEHDRLRLEGELRQSQRLESVGRLAGGVAHDFNNLLAAILTYSEFIAEDLGPDHPLQGDVAEVRKAARRATDLTRQLLVFSRRDLVKASVLDVNDAITDLLNLLQRTLGEDIELDHDAQRDLPRVLADPGELEQVLVNLAVNARDAIVGQGTITVETSEQVDRR